MYVNMDIRLKRQWIEIRTPLDSGAETNVIHPRLWRNATAPLPGPPIPLKPGVRSQKDV